MPRSKEEILAELQGNYRPSGDNSDIKALMGRPVNIKKGII